MDTTRDELKQETAEVARQGIYLGASSWKYEGWCGQIYTELLYPKQMVADALRSRVMKIINRLL
jgi:hypothetical protein